MNIRRGRIEDLKILNEISVRSKRHWGYPESWIEEWKGELTITKESFAFMDVLVICEASDIFGFCAVSETSDHYEIEHLWVLPEYIGKGYGRELLNKSLEMIAPGRKDIIVTADPHAEDFYRKFGFKTVKSVESTSPGRFLPVMIKQLKMDN